MSRESSNVTLRDVYSIANEIKDDLAVVLKDHDSRIRDIERLKDRLWIIGIVLATLPSLAVSYLWNMVLGRK